MSSDVSPPVNNDNLLLGIICIFFIVILTAWFVFSSPAPVPSSQPVIEGIPQ